MKINEFLQEILTLMHSGIGSDSKDRSSLNASQKGDLLTLAINIVQKVPEVRQEWNGLTPEQRDNISLEFGDSLNNIFAVRK